MATKPRIVIKPSFGRLPGRVSEGSKAFYKKQAIGTARASMQNVTRQYEKFVRHLQGVTPDIVRNALEPVFDKSQVYVPVDKGYLKESGQLNVETEGGQVIGTITYGDARAWYAALVHEYVWLNHEPPTRAKYLQSAMEEELDQFMVSVTLDYSLAMGMV
jgi:hypothetical protein